MTTDISWLQQHHSRRHLLQTGVTLAAAALLAACTTPGKPAAPTPSPTPSTTMNLDNQEIHLLAMSGTLPNTSQRDNGLSRLRKAGFQISNAGCIERQYQRFAGTDQQRLNDLAQLAQRDSMPRMLLAGRGGYGACRLLPHIDYKRLCPMLQEAGTQIVGYSDFSAIQLALLAQGQVGSFAGPMLYSDFGSKHVSSYTMQQFISATTQDGWTIQSSTIQLHQGQGEGVFWGGNLSVLTSLVGSPYLPDIKGGLLFLEDVGEQPYRVERMLQQLYLAGILQQQKAIFLGDFGIGRLVDAYDPGYTLDSVIQQMRQQLNIPVFSGIPFGHIHDKTTLPLGYPARYVSDGDGLRLSFSDYPWHSATGLNLDSLLGS